MKLVEDHDISEAIILPELTLEISKLDQYVQSLAVQRKAWSMEHYALVLLSDNEFIKGNDSG